MILSKVYLALGDTSTSESKWSTANGGSVRPKVVSPTFLGIWPAVELHWSHGCFQIKVVGRFFVDNGRPSKTLNSELLNHARCHDLTWMDDIDDPKWCIDPCCPPVIFVVQRPQGFSVWVSKSDQASKLRKSGTNCSICKLLAATTAAPQLMKSCMPWDSWLLNHVAWEKPWENREELKRDRGKREKAIVGPGQTSHDRMMLTWVIPKSTFTC